MADPRFSDDEQLEKIKDWWRRNGLAIIIGGTLGIGGVAGWHGYHAWKDARAERASTIYERLIEHKRADDADGVRARAAELMDDYRATPYGAQGAMMLARVQIEAGDTAAAIETLRWGLDNAVGDSLRHTVRLALVRLLIDTEDFAAAELVLTDLTPGGFVSEYAELRGDLHASAGRFTQAVEAYREAIEALGAGSPYADILQMKLQDAETSGESE